MLANLYLFISAQEIFVILIIIVLLFGSKKIPELARGLGKGIRELKDASNEIKHEIHKTTDKIEADVNKINDDLNKE
tara:strand:- start:749 stop:979 length:231 start_codon:yes stop_codon:yes gene_type:complete